MKECPICGFQNPDDAVKCNNCQCDIELTRKRIQDRRGTNETNKIDVSINPQINAGIIAFVVLIIVSVGGYFLMQAWFSDIVPKNTTEEIISALEVALVPCLSGLLLMWGTYNFLVRRFRTSEWLDETTKKYGDTTAKRAKDTISHYSPILRKIFRQVGGERLIMASLKYESDTHWIAKDKVNLGKQWIESEHGFREVVDHYSIKIEAIFDFPEANIKYFLVTGGSPSNRRIPLVKKTSNASVEELARVLTEVIEAGPLVEEKLYS